MKVLEVGMKGTGVCQVTVRVNGVECRVVKVKVIVMGVTIRDT